MSATPPRGATQDFPAAPGQYTLLIKAASMPTRRARRGPHCPIALSRASCMPLPNPHSDPGSGTAQRRTSRPAAHQPSPDQRRISSSVLNKPRAPWAGDMNVDRGARTYGQEPSRRLLQRSVSQSTASHSKAAAAPDNVGAIAGYPTPIPLAEVCLREQRPVGSESTCPFPEDGQRPL